MPVLQARQMQACEPVGATIVATEPSTRPGAPSSTDPEAPEYSPFCSRTVTRHLARGIAGLALAIWALANASAHPVLAIGAGVLMVAAWRGCPMCWTLGLVETVVRRVTALRS